MAGLLSAESYPSWWNFTPPDSTALVGIQWETVRPSDFGDAVSTELFGAGSVGLPELPLLLETRQMLVSGPDLLAIASGSFPSAAFRAQASALKFKRAMYRDTELWIASDRASLSMAHVSDALVLVGSRKTLQDAIDRSLLETGRQYSPLLSRAARIAPGKDLWIVADALPDALASRFVPLDASAANFEGSVAIGNGLSLDARFERDSKQSASESADVLKAAVHSLPLILRSLEVSTESNTVFLTLQVDRTQMDATLRRADSGSDAPDIPAQPAEPQPNNAQPMNGAVNPGPKAVEHPAQSVAGSVAPTPGAAPVAAAATPRPAAPAPATTPVASAVPAPAAEKRPAVPQVIRIYGLDEGVREILLEPAR